MKKVPMQTGAYILAAVLALAGCAPLISIGITNAPAVPECVPGKPACR